MTRLILVTFAMLGWTFYIMSGGPNFEPRGKRAPKPEIVAVAPSAKPESPAPATAEDLVTRAALQPSVPVEPIAEPVAETLATTTDASEAQALLAQVSLGLSAPLSTFGETGASFTLASLEDGAASLQQLPAAEPTAAPVVEEPPKDIRESAGTRVNMRDGPGTIYPVIAKVRLGQKVEVLDTSQTGWLRLRVLPEQQIGWISASLVSKSTH